MFFTMFRIEFTVTPLNMWLQIIARDKRMSTVRTLKKKKRFRLENIESNSILFLQENAVAVGSLKFSVEFQWFSFVFLILFLFRSIHFLIVESADDNLHDPNEILALNFDETWRIFYRDWFWFDRFIIGQLTIDLFLTNLKDEPKHVERRRKKK